jgi:hypothetical protein
MKSFLLSICLFTISKLANGNQVFMIIIHTPISTKFFYKDTLPIFDQLYGNLKILPSKNEYGFDYNYNFNKNTKIITVTCKKKIDSNNLKFVIVLKDSKGIYDKNTFSVGDDYKYITSYFMIDNFKLSVSRLHALNSENNFLTQISDVWSKDKSINSIKYYRINQKTIYLIKGTNPYCNGHNCSDYVIYLLQKKNEKVSINALYLSGTSNFYNFNNLNLFFNEDTKNPEFYFPKKDSEINSKQDLNIYKIYFDKLVQIPGSTTNKSK